MQRFFVVAGNNGMRRVVGSQRNRDDPDDCLNQEKKQDKSSPDELGCLFPVLEWDGVIKFAHCSGQSWLMDFNLVRDLNGIWEVDPPRRTAEKSICRVLFRLVRRGGSTSQRLLKQLLVKRADQFEVNRSGNLFFVCHANL